MNELIKVKVENANGTLVTTSNRVAEELGVNHRGIYLKKLTIMLINLRKPKLRLSEKSPNLLSFTYLVPTQ